MSRTTYLAGLEGALGLTQNQYINPQTVTAAGSNSQANSTLLSTIITIVVSLSAITTRGVRLPNLPRPGRIAQVINLQTTNLKVYPGTSAKLGQGASANANVSLAALKTKTWIATSALQWVLINQLA